MLITIDSFGINKVQWIMENKWLNYHHLLYFRTIANEGSISKASVVLKVGQSSLSSQLKNLEDSLEQKLFLRQNRSLVLTEAGKIALQYANEIFKKGEEFLHIFNEESLTLKTNYRIGVVDSAPKLLTGKLSEACISINDQCIVQLTEGTSEYLLEELNNHRLDIALTTSKEAFVDDSEIIFKNLGDAKIKAYASNKFSHLRDSFPDSLDLQPLILPTKHSKLRYDLEHYFYTKKIHHKTLFEVQDSSVKKMIALNGKGIVFLPEFAAQVYVDDGRLVCLGELEGVLEDYWLVTKKRTFKLEITESIMKNFRI
jgi:LysR family transcriptional activator of nhaA